MEVNERKCPKAKKMVAIKGGEWKSKYLSKIPLALHRDLPRTRSQGKNSDLGPIPHLIHIISWLPFCRHASSAWIKLIKGL